MTCICAVGAHSCSLHVEGSKTLRGPSRAHSRDSHRKGKREEVRPRPRRPGPRSFTRKSRPT
uniref:Uncharacterized protein n=1 Tax=Mustela putorius furo TaxID=9669 RepID=M3YS22_MUSPF